MREGEEDAVIADKEAAGTVAAVASVASDEVANSAPESATDDARFRELRQRKDELTQRHREHERRKQQLRVSHFVFFRLVIQAFPFTCYWAAFTSALPINRELVSRSVRGKAVE